ncbi:E1-E2 ATPase family protein [Corchorus olitorius]|uniref:E1-E2 ATPase family protein n=1 Tax=Corchorus olitorius TaxID=93759 RepID=A0A1R3KNR5_9ROSI|nr:E1-E2 ATPase family protein [Corchorus olitorius]
MPAPTHAANSDSNHDLSPASSQGVQADAPLSQDLQNIVPLPQDATVECCIATGCSAATRTFVAILRSRHPTEHQYSLYGNSVE